MAPARHAKTELALLRLFVRLTPTVAPAKHARTAAVQRRPRARRMMIVNSIRSANPEFVKLSAQLLISVRWAKAASPESVLLADVPPTTIVPPARLANPARVFLDVLLTPTVA